MIIVEKSNVLKGDLLSSKDMREGAQAVGGEELTQFVDGCHTGQKDRFLVWSGLLPGPGHATTCA
jgi:hypothetical protein